ncbi:MAG TPA: TetR/AcrR family transcriptional regulator [Ktedonobacteraceae bacterium]|nr:TetR/AcrR family transcriptional regulator [Ktedonobacteraceae bacterium]
MPRLPDPERRALILRVARQHFARAGFTSTTMADIARAAGMGVGSLYVYFPTKDTIALTLLHTYLDELERAIVPPMMDLHGGEALARSIAVGFQLAACNEDIILLLHQVPPEMSVPICQQLPQALEPAVARQINQGHFRPGNPQFTTQWVNNQINWAITACVLEKRDSLASYQQQLTDLISRALLPNPGSSQKL